TSTSNRPVLPSTNIISPVFILAILPPSIASGVTWMAAGTLPDAPDIRPSVTNATLKPRSCSTPSGGVNLCSSGIPQALGPWKRTTTIQSLFRSPALKAASSSCWLENTTAGAFTTSVPSRSAEVLITPRPTLPDNTSKPPWSLNGFLTVAKTSVSSEDSGASTHTNLPSCNTGCWVRSEERRVGKEGVV